MMFPPVFSVCAASSAVTALLGTDPVRLYPFAEAPQTTPEPYAVWQLISGAPENFINGLPDMDQYSIQIDCYASSAAGAREVAEALRDAIEPRAHIVRWSQDLIDADTNLRRFSFDVDWFVPR